MQLSVSVLLFLLLWGNAQVSLSQNACSKLPDVSHAHVSEETKKTAYQEGDVIHFTCETGYTSSQISKYVCLREGWLTVHQGTCYSCSTLPDVPHAHISEETKKTDYQEGDVIHFTCEPGYTSGPTIKYVCMSAGWLAVRQGTCYILASSCDPPPADGGVTVKGLPENGDPILPDHIITFSCDGPGKYLSGSSVLICGNDGQWHNPFPSCEDITCKVDVMHPHLYVAGLPPTSETMKIGHRLQFQCDNQYTLDGSVETECLESGQWNTPFPTCFEKCKVTGVSDSVHIITHVPGNLLRKGQNLRLRCRRPEHFLHGNAVVECLANGQWSHPFPTCGPPLGCQRPPPPLADGDTKESGRIPYRHNERVEYICQSYYTMEGEPYQTCINGEWTGQMRCIKKCKVTGVSDSVHIITHVPGNLLRKGQNLTFHCRWTEHFLHGNAEVECLANGQWSHPFPTCGPPLGCRRPPPLLEDGDTKESGRIPYRHNERVEYICQSYYTMEGEPYQTCINGEWTGQMRCIKPCTVDKEAMSRHNIAFRYSYDDKKYSAHNDEIEFRCTRGSRVGTVKMRQRCVEGVMQLPTCQPRFNS